MQRLRGKGGRERGLYAQKDALRPVRRHFRFAGAGTSQYIPAPPAARPAPPPKPAAHPSEKKTAPVAPIPAPRSRVAEPPPSSTSIKAPSPRRAGQNSDPDISAGSESYPTKSIPAQSVADDSDDDEFAFSDGKDTPAYVKTGKEIRECPFCHATVNPDAISCCGCGFMLTDLKTERGHPLERRWETGWSFRRRLIGFLICQALSIASVAGGIMSGLSPFTLVFPFVMYAGMTAFLFGSYNWVDLARNKKGKLRLRQTWRICFFERPPTTLKIREYEELATGVEHDFGTTDWIVFLFLLLCGVLPGLWWWFYAGSKNTYFVSLCRDHGYPVVTLYRGWDQDKMEDMAETISKVARLPLRR